MSKIKDARIWSVLIAGVVLRVLPERVKGQHRAGDIVVWLSAFPKVK
jgi:hypothetical protein